MHLRNCTGYQWRAVQYFSTYFPDAEKPFSDDPKGRREGYGEDKGPQNLRDPGQRQSPFKETNSRDWKAHPKIRLSYELGMKEEVWKWIY